MSSYQQEFNKDNVVLRYAIVGLLAEMRNKVYFYNHISNEESVKIQVPFYYSVTGSERLLVDEFLYEATNNGEAIGNYETVPRAILTISGVSIDSSNMTNKYTRTKFTHEYEGQLKTLYLEAAFLPMNLSFDVTAVCSNNLEMLKLTESIMSKLYKATFFSIDFGMFKVDASVEVPEDYTNERQFEYSLNDKKEYSVTFPIELKTFMPVFEDGILLSEIDGLIDRNSALNGTGVGLFRNGRIYFGGVMEEFNTSVDDIKKAPIPSNRSNLTYIDPDSINSGPVFTQNDILPDDGNKETTQSKIWRNGKSTE